MNRRRASAVIGSVLALAGAWPGPALAGEEWCMSDPAVPIRTPGGTTVVVHLSEYALGTEHRAALARATHTYTAAASGGRTAVELRVFIPDDETGRRFRTRAVVSTEPHAAGEVLATAEGWSGEPLVLRFTLAVP